MRLALLLSLVLTGCGTIETDPRVPFSAETGPAWGLDPGCETAGLAEVERGAALWAEITDLERDDATADITICIVPGPFWGGRYGSTTWSDDGAEITVRGDIAGGWLLASVTAHELGHALMRTGEHLPAGRTGIMAADIDGLERAFTESDMELLARHGF